MKRKWSLQKMTAAVLTGVLLFSGADGISAVAVEKSKRTYTVRFRPGNVGCFSLKETTGEAEKTKKESAEEVARFLYDGLEEIQDIRITENGAIKLTVEKGAAVPVAPDASCVRADDGYFVKAVSEWGPQEGAVVTRNMDFVVDYGRLAVGSKNPEDISVSNQSDDNAENSVDTIVFFSQEQHKLLGYTLKGKEENSHFSSKIAWTISDER